MNKTIIGEQSPLPQALTAVLIAAAVLFSPSTSHAQGFDQELLTDPELDSGSSPLLPFSQNMLNRWMQENASLVVGQQPDGVSPFDGDGMVRIMAASPSVTRVRQRINVTALAGDIDLGLVTANAGGLINTSTNGVFGGIVVTSLDIGEIVIDSSFGGFTLDGNAGSWETSATSLLLAPGTRHVELIFAFAHATLPFGESVYGDSASLMLSKLFPDFCNGDGGNHAGCTNCPCLNNATRGTIGGCLNASGTSARLVATGSPSASLPPGSVTDLRFALVDANPGIGCILASGQALAPLVGPCIGMNSGAPFFLFNGLRCAIVDWKKHGYRVTDSTGEVGGILGGSPPNDAWGGEGRPAVGLIVASGFVAGQTRFFQGIYRDEPICGRPLNTTQAIEVTFTP